jgi:hypothetical protein
VPALYSPGKLSLNAIKVPLKDAPRLGELSCGFKAASKPDYGWRWRHLHHITKGVSNRLGRQDKRLQEPLRYNADYGLISLTAGAWVEGRSFLRDVMLVEVGQEDSQHEAMAGKSQPQNRHSDPPSSGLDLMEVKCDLNE